MCVLPTTILWTESHETDFIPFLLNHHCQTEFLAQNGSSVIVCGLRFNLTKGIFFIVLNCGNLFCLCPAHIPWHSPPVHYLLTQQLPKCKSLGLWAWRLSLPWVLGQVRCARKLSLQGAALNDYLMGAGPVCSLLHPLVERCLRPALCRLPEVLRGQETHCVSSSLLINAPCTDCLPWLVSFVCLPSRLLALRSLYWGLILGNSNSVQL